MYPANAPQQTAQATHDRTTDLHRPLRQHSWIRTPTVALIRLLNAATCQAQKVPPRYSNASRSSNGLDALQRPVAADEFQMQTRDTVGSGAAAPHGGQPHRCILLTADPDKASRRNRERSKNCRALLADIFGYGFLALRDLA